MSLLWSFSLFILADQAFKEGRARALTHRFLRDSSFNCEVVRRLVDRELVSLNKLMILTIELLSGFIKGKVSLAGEVRQHLRMIFTVQVGSNQLTNFFMCLRHF